MLATNDSLELSFVDNSLNTSFESYSEPQATIPTFTVGELIRVNHEGKLNTLLNRLIDATEHKTIAELAFCIARKMIKQVPVRYKTANDLAAFIFSHNQNISQGTRQNIHNYIAKQAQKGKKKATDLISMTDIKLRHDYQLITNLDDINTDFERGVMLLSAPHGIGKTERVGVPFARKEIASQVTTICHLKSLTADMRTRFDCSDYELEAAAIKDIAIQGNISQAEAHQYKQIDRLSICLPSIVLALEECVKATKTLIIDEVAQVLSFLLSDVVTRSTLPAINTQNIYNRLRDTIASAERVLVMDADLDDTVIKFIEQCRPNERFNIFEMPRFDAGYSVDWCYGNGYKAKAESYIISQLYDNKRMFIGCDSQTLTAAMEDFIQGYNPNLKIMRIDSSTTHRKEVKEFLGKPSKHAHKYDLIIHSPSMKSGVSIVEGCFDVGIYIFSGQSIGSSDAIQMMRRDRKLKHWSLFVDDVHNEAAMTASAMTTAQEQADEIQANSQNRQAEKATQFDVFVNEQRSKEQMLKEDFANNLYYQLESYHFKITHVDFTGGESATANIAKEQKAEFEQAIISSPAISRYDYDNLKQRNNLNEKEKAQTAAYEIMDFMGCTRIDEAMLATWDEGRVKAKVKRLSRIIDTQEPEQASSEPISIKAYRDVETKLLTKAIALMGISASKDGISGVIDSEHQGSVKAWANDNRIILAYMGLISKELANPKSKIKCAKKLINGILEKAGIETTSKQVREGDRKDNKRIRVMTVKESSVNIMLKMANGHTSTNISKQNTVKCDQKEAQKIEYPEQSAGREEAYFTEQKTGANEAIEIGEIERQAKHDEYELLTAIELSKTKHMDEIGNSLIAKGWTVDRVNNALQTARKNRRVNFDIQSEIFL